MGILMKNITSITVGELFSESVKNMGLISIFPLYVQVQWRIVGLHVEMQNAHNKDNARKYQYH